MVRDDTQRVTSEVTAKSREHEGLGGKKSRDFSTMEKCRYNGLKNLLLIEQRYETKKPRSLLQKRRLKRYLKLLTRIMG